MNPDAQTPDPIVRRTDLAPHEAAAQAAAVMAAAAEASFDPVYALQYAQAANQLSEAAKRLQHVWNH